MIQHKDLAEGRWQTMPLVEQLANVGSEVGRSIAWRKKNQREYALKAFFRAIELIDLSINDPKNKSRLRELTRVREVLSDFLFGDNEWNSTEASWQAYFLQFAYAARKNC